MGHTRLDPGIAADARKIFINDATNGTPEKSGWMWDLRMDFLYRLRILGLQDAYAYAGVRYSMFTGNFKYIGGNEDFDVTSNQWGWGAGVKASFPMGKIVAFTLPRDSTTTPQANCQGTTHLIAPMGKRSTGGTTIPSKMQTRQLTSRSFSPS